MISHPLALERLARAIDLARRAALKPPPSMTVPEWADTYRHLSSASGAFAGQWDTSRVEVARGPMMAVTEPGVSIITAMTCTQLLKTSLLENVIGYKAHLDPAPMLLTQPKDEAVKAFSKERIAPMIEVTPVLKAIMGGRVTRNSEDTLNYKKFPGGFLAMASAGSPTNLAMRAIRDTYLDEIDKYETTREGDPVLLAEERTATFGDRALKIRTCSPTLEETSRIFASYLEGDQRRPFVQCPHCGEWFVLDFFRHVEWKKSEDGIHYPETAAIYCDTCGAAWSEAQRLATMTTRNAVRHMQTKKFTHCEVRQDPQADKKWDWSDALQVGYAVCKCCGERAVPNRHASFTASKLYSPFTSTVEIAQKWISAKGDPERKQTFYNTILGKPFKAQVSKALSINVLVSRCELYPAPVPRGGLVLTAGIDVQSSGRFEVEVVAWGLNEESWSIDQKVVTGDISHHKTWDELDDYLKQPWRHEIGIDLYLSAACIDSGGHNTQAVYAFAQARHARNIWAIKGASDKGNQWSPVWPLEKPNKWRPSGFKPLIVGSNAAKEAVRSRLALDEIGPGYCHFPVGRSEAWFDQLVSENIVLERRGFETVRRWVLPRGRANEALDCRAYAYAALHGLYSTRKLNLDKQAALFDNLASKSVEPSQPASKVHKSSWMEQ